MRTCTRCGASPYVDADPYCEHAYYEPPEPSVVTFDGAPIPWVDFAPPAPPPERLWNAIGVVDDQAIHARHPTREGAIALWQERWTWRPAIAALFGWLCERPIRIGYLSPERHAKTLAALEKLGADWTAPIIGGPLRPGRSHALAEADALAIVDSLDRHGGEIFAANTRGAEPWTLTVDAGGGYWMRRRGHERYRANRDDFVAIVAEMLREPTHG